VTRSNSALGLVRDLLDANKDSNPSGSPRWHGRTFLIGLFVLASLSVDALFLAHYLDNKSYWFSDAELYWRATQAWIGGGNPWAVHVENIRFAGVPPTLLANLPLLPFGPDVARPFWAIAGLASWLLVIWRLRMPLWWLPFSPFVEAWLAGSPDVTLVALAVFGCGAIAPVIKPYAVPGLLAVGRWKAVVAGALLALVTLPLLPWTAFLEQNVQIRATLDAQAMHLAAWGDWPVWVLSLLALISLGPRLGLGLAVPVLAPATQLHYALFSVEAMRRSPWLALTLTIPGAAPLGTVAYAVARWWWPRWAGRIGPFAGAVSWKSTFRRTAEEPSSSRS
jgi:hypothetical protein